MKLSHFVGIILFVGFVFLSWGMITEDFETNYVETNVTEASVMNSSYQGHFQYASIIEDNLGGLTESFSTMQEDESWLDILGDSAVALPIAVIRFPVMMIQLIKTTISGTAVVGEQAGIPSEVIQIGTVGLLIFGLFKLLSFWRRTPV